MRRSTMDRPYQVLGQVFRVVMSNRDVFMEKDRGEHPQQ